MIQSGTFTVNIYLRIIQFNSHKSLTLSTLCFNQTIFCSSSLNMTTFIKTVNIIKIFVVDVSDNFKCFLM